MLALVALVVLQFGCVSAYQAREEYQRVLLTDVQTLTLHQDAMTTARRSTPIKQLQCQQKTYVGHAMRSRCGPEYQPAMVQCHNMGTDGVDVQWKCDAELPNHVRFGEIEVSCEGYAYPEDPFVLAGSCGLKYVLLEHGPRTARTARTDDDGLSKMTNFLIVTGVMVVMCLVCCGFGAFMIYCAPGSDDGSDDGSDTGRAERAEHSKGRVRDDGDWYTWDPWWYSRRQWPMSNHVTVVHTGGGCSSSETGGGSAINDATTRTKSGYGKTSRRSDNSGSSSNSKSSGGWSSSKSSGSSSGFGFSGGGGFGGTTRR